MKLANPAARGTPSQPPVSPTDTKASAKASQKQQPVQQSTQARATLHRADGFDTKRPDARAAVLLGAPAQPSPMAAAAKQTGSVKPLKFGDDIFTTPAPASTPAVAQEIAKATSVPTVGDKRAALEAGQRELFTQTQARADSLFAMANGTEEPPKNATVTVSPDGVVTLTQMDETGTQPVSITTAEKFPSGTVKLETVRKEGERFQRESITSMPNIGASSETRADWKAAEGATLGTAPSMEELRQSRDPDVRVSETIIEHEGENLRTRGYTQQDGGVQQSMAFYQRVTDRKGIADDLQGTLQHGVPTDTVNIQTYTLAPPKEDGTQEPALYTDVRTWSQPGAQVTRTDSRPLDFKGQATLSAQPHNAEDLAAVTARHDPNSDKNRDYPRQWVIEKSAMGEYQSQTFMEGSKEASIVLKRRAEGDKLIEEYSGKTFSTDPEVEGLVKVEGRTERTFGADGSLMSMSSATTNADGSKTRQSYERTNTPADDGLHMLEKSSVEQTDKKGETFKSETHTDSLLSGQGLQLKSTDTYLVTPDGTKTHSRLDAKGEKYFVTAPGSEEASEVTDPSQLPLDPNVREALLQASVTTLMTVKDYAANGGKNALSLLQKSGEAFDETVLRGNVMFGGTAVHSALKGIAGIAGAAAGAAGVAGSGMLLMQGIRDKNVPQIIQNAAAMGKSGYDMYQGSAQFMKVMKNLLTNAPYVVDDAAAAASWLGRGANVAGAAFGVYMGATDLYEGIRKGNGWQVAKGTVGIAGSVISGMLGAGFMFGSFGGPVGSAAGMAAGLLVGVVTWGIGKVFDYFDKSEYDLAPVAI